MQMVSRPIFRLDTAIEQTSFQSAELRGGFDRARSRSANCDSRHVGDVAADASQRRHLRGKLSQVTPIGDTSATAARQASRDSAKGQEASIGTAVSKESEAKGTSENSRRGFGPPPQ